MCLRAKNLSRCQPSDGVAFLVKKKKNIKILIQLFNQNIWKYFCLSDVKKILK